MRSAYNYRHTDIHLRAGRSSCHLRSSRRSRGRPSRAHAKKREKKEGKRSTPRRGSARGSGRKEEGTRIWPLQLEERGKAGVANPCKEPLYFPKEMLRAPDVLSPLSLSREKKIAGPVERLSACLFPRRPRVTATRAARFQHVSTTWEGSRVPGRSNLPIFSSP